MSEPRVTINVTRTQRAKCYAMLDEIEQRSKGASSARGVSVHPRDMETLIAFARAGLQATKPTK